MKVCLDLFDTFRLVQFVYVDEFQCSAYVPSQTNPIELACVVLRYAVLHCKGLVETYRIFYFTPLHSTPFFFLPYSTIRVVIYHL